MIQDLDALSIASMGLLSDNSLTIASDGFIVLLEEEIIDIFQQKVGGGLDYYTQQEEWAKQKKHWDQFKVKKIKASATINKRTYVTEIIVKDLTLNLKDVIVKVDETNLPIKLKIILPEGTEIINERYEK